MRFFVLAGLVSVLVLSPLCPQTADVLEELLEKPAVSWSEAAAFVLEASEAGAYDAAGAFGYASEQKWLPKDAQPGDTVSIKGLSLLLMRSFDLDGGLFYKITKSPHHAYRELVYKGISRGDIDPGIPVSGRELLFMVNKILSIKEKEAAK